MNKWMEEQYEALGISREVYEFGEKIEDSLKERFAAIDATAEYNQLKVIKAMQDNRVSAECFNMSSGYGYNDLGRDTLEKEIVSLDNVNARIAELLEEIQKNMFKMAKENTERKTTIAKRLYDEALKNGSVSLLKIDDYYYNKDKIPLSNNGKRNYDHPDSYDSSLILEHLQNLKKGIAINKPLYDFVTQSRKTTTEKIYPSNVIIVEGIMAFAIDKLLNLYDIKIFVDTPDDIRFIRRLQRDMTIRGRILDSVVCQYLESVRPMHHAFVEPSKKYADIIIPEGGYNDVAFDILMSKIEKLQK